MGALLHALFWTSQAGSFLFPGAKGLEAEYPAKEPRVGGVWLNERAASALILALLALGYSIERGRRRSEPSVPAR